MKKFAQCSEWFEWISRNLLGKMVADYSAPSYLQDYRPIAFDATVVTEKGAIGRTYRLHYGIDIFGMGGISYKITKQEVGETLVNFALGKTDLAIADRAYGTLSGIKHCIDSGADYILRLRANHFAIYDKDDNKVNILAQVKHLEHEQVHEIYGFIKLASEESGHYKPTPIRICIRRKSAYDCEKSAQNLKRKKYNKGHKTTRQSTLEFNEHILPRHLNIAKNWLDKIA